MAQLRHRETGNVINVPDEIVLDALERNPDLELASSVEVDLGAGNRALVSPENADSVLSNPAVGTPETAETGLPAAQAALLEQEYGEGLGNTLAATGLGAARGLSFGLSDVVAAGVLDADQRYAIRQLRDQNPAASVAGEVGGALAPLLLTGGTSSLASAASLTPAALATRAGSSLASRVAGEGVAKAVMRGAIEAATEGAAYGLGSTVGTAALNDDPLTVETVAANMSLGAILGGATGGVVGAAGAAARRALSKVPPATATAPVEEMALGLRRAASKTDDLIGEARLARKADPALAFDSEVELADSLWRQKGAAQRARAFATKNEEMVAFPELQQRLGSGLGFNIERGAATRPLITDVAEVEIRAALKGLRNDLGDGLDLGKLFTLDKARARRVADNLHGFVESATRLDNQVGQRFGIGLDVGADAVIRQVEKAGLAEQFSKMAPADVVSMLEGKAPATARGLEKLAKAEAWYNGLNPTAQNALKAWAVAQTQTPAAVAARKGVVGTVAKHVGRFAAKRAVGTILGFGGGVAYGAGSAVGMVMAGAAALLPTGMATEIGLLTTKAVAALAKPATAKGATVASYLASTRFGQSNDKNAARARMKEIAEAVANPETNNALRMATLPLGLQNPATAEKVKAALQTRLSYLHERSPWRMPERVLKMAKTEPQPSRYEVQKWGRIVRAAENPLTLLEDLRDRRITPEAVQTVKDLYPTLFQQMQLSVMEQLPKIREGFPYQARLQVAVFFDTPVDASQAPEFGATIASLYNQAGQATAQPRGSLGTPEPDATQTQRLTAH